VVLACLTLPSPPREERFLNSPYSGCQISVHEHDVSTDASIWKNRECLSSPPLPPGGEGRGEGDLLDRGRRAHSAAERTATSAPHPHPSLSPRGERESLSEMILSEYSSENRCKDTAFAAFFGAHETPRIPPKTEAAGCHSLRPIRDHLVVVLECFKTPRPRADNAAVGVRLVQNKADAEGAGGGQDRFGIVDKKGARFVETKPTLCLDPVCGLLLWRTKID